MNTCIPELSAEQPEQFHRDGFTIVRGFLSREEATRWRRNGASNDPIEGFTASLPRTSWLPTS